MTAVKKFFSNPILLFGLRRRMKKTSTLILMLIIVGGISFVLTFILASFVTVNQTYSGIAESGNETFLVTAAVHAAAIFFFSAASSAGEISGEKARQTMDLLVCSQLTPAELVRGKIFNSLAFSFLITITMLPVYAMISTFGGISVSMVIAVFLLIFAFATVISSVAIAASSIFRKSAVATLMTFLVIAFLSLFAIIAAAAYTIFAEIVNNYANYSVGISIIYIDESYAETIAAFSPFYFIYLVLDICIEGFSQAFNNTTTYNFIIGLTSTPIGCFATAFLSILIAKKTVNPLKSSRIKG